MLDIADSVPASFELEEKLREVSGFSVCDGPVELFGVEGRRLVGFFFIDGRRLVVSSIISFTFSDDFWLFDDFWFGEHFPFNVFFVDLGWFFATILQ